MVVLISYDVATTSYSGAKRLRNMAKTCKDYGQRVQKSVFECDVDPAQWEKLRAKLLKIYDERKDSLRFYFLGSNWRRRIEHHGVQIKIDMDEPVIL